MAQSLLCNVCARTAVGSQKFLDDDVADSCIAACAGWFAASADFESCCGIESVWIMSVWVGGLLPPPLAGVEREDGGLSPCHHGMGYMCCVLQFLLRLSWCGPHS